MESVREEERPPTLSIKQYFPFLVRMQAWHGALKGKLTNVYQRSLSFRPTTNVQKTECRCSQKQAAGGTRFSEKKEMSWCICEWIWVCAYMHVWARGECWEPVSLRHLSLNTEYYDFCWTGWPASSGDPPFYFPRVRTAGTHFAHESYKDARTQSRSPCLHGKLFTESFQQSQGNERITLLL